MFTYLLSARTGRDQAKVDLLTASAIASANAIALRADAAAFGRGLDELLVGLERRGRAPVDEPVGRGRCSARRTRRRFRDAIAMQLDHLLGRNIYDRTQVTGVGYHPPNKPHHRPSEADNVGVAWPGLLVGGANPDADRNVLPALTWKDNADDYDLNEVAINWNAPLIYAAAALTPPLVARWPG